MIRSTLKAFFGIKGAFLFLFVLAVCCTSTGIAKAEDAAQSPVITGIDVQEGDSLTEIRIDSNAPLSYTIYKPSDPFRVVVELRDVGLGRFKDKMVIDKSGVMEIIPMEVEGAAKTVRLEITLSAPVELKPLLRDNTLVLSFPKSEPPALEMQDASASADESAKEALKEAPAPIEKPAVAAQEKPDASKPEAAPQAGAKYPGEKISLDFQDADLLHIFRLLADVSGYNIVVHPEVKGKFSMRILNVPWDQALDIILRNYSLSKIIEGNIIRIAPTNVLAREGEDLAKAKEAEIKSGDIETIVYPINYADVDKVKSTIETAKVLTSMGFISTDKRTSSVIIKDVKEKHKEYAALIKSLDQATPQVSIEARLVEVTTSFSKELGIQWGALWKPADSRMTLGGTGIPGGTGFSNANPLMVNLPASVSSGSGGAIGLGYISASSVFALDLQLSAMESSGQGKIISNPKITTMDNQKATIKQGRKIPYSTTSSEGTKTEFVDANLELTVTPHITPEGTIVMDVDAKKNEADFAQTSGGVPTIDTKEATTQVLVKDGDTLVIGGIFKTTKSTSDAGVPFLSKIPVLGWLFKKEADTDNTSELLIFITPRVLK